MTSPSLLPLEHNDPQRLELAYHQARREGREDEFVEAIESEYAANPNNVLIAAWHFRFMYAATRAAEKVIAWVWAIPLAMLNGVLFWVLSDDQRFMLRVTNPATGFNETLIPLLALLLGPLSALFVLLYLALAGERAWKRVVAIVAALALVSGYALLTYSRVDLVIFQQQYLNLSAIHLPLLAWAGVGAFVLWGRSDAENRFAFLIKSLEAIILGGLFIIAGGLFISITLSLFSALGVEPPELILRLLVAGGGGLIPVLAVAVIYDPLSPPIGQSFREGLSRLLAVLMRILLPMSLLVLVIYLGFIPFNFREPFENRDVLIIYNIMLFAVMALLVGATPVRVSELDEKQAVWLRRGILAVAALSLLVGIYALTAILYRTWIDKLTPNRLTFIGWNIINIGILAWLLFKQARGRSGHTSLDWNHRSAERDALCDRPQGHEQNKLRQLHEVFAAGAVLYAAWALIILLYIPWGFGVDPLNVRNMPPEIQRVVYTQPQPVLLKCPTSPHIYLLEKGRKRWVKDIATFEAQGYEWRDVNFVSCQILRGIPDGSPIPPDAGPPPEP
ncbi:MAG: hypothetical protein GXP42_05245 [Chloroflexi bacterium]|nr:hypothetical protein [Chloroflexota bacterium]